MSVKRVEEILPLSEKDIVSLYTEDLFQNSGIIFNQLSGSGTYFSKSEFSKLMNIALKSDIIRLCPVFVNSDNLSHEVSALLSVLCFHKRGCYKHKLILNFDHHRDYTGLNKDDKIQFLN